MADTYTSRNGLRKQQTNANKNTWGTILNDSVIELIDQSNDGWTNLAMTGNVTLTSVDGAADQARSRVLNITSTGGVARTITVPAKEKVYQVRNAGTSTVLVKTAAGVGVSILQGQNAWVFCNGTECYRGAASGWGLLSTANLTSGTTANISVAVTGQAFSDLRIVLTSLTAGAVPSFTYTLTGPGGTTPSSTLLASAGTEVSGGINIDAYALDGGVGYQAAYASTSNPMISPGTNSNFRWRLAGGISSFTLSSSNAFSAGTVEVYLR